MFSSKVQTRMFSSRDTQAVKIFSPSAACQLVTEKVVQLYPMSQTLSVSSTKNSNSNNFYKFKTHENRSNLSVTLTNKSNESLNENKGSMNQIKVVNINKTEESKTNVLNTNIDNNNKFAFKKSHYLNPMKATINLHPLSSNNNQFYYEPKRILLQVQIDYSEIDDNYIEINNSDGKNEENLIDNFLFLDEKFGNIINNLKSSKNVSNLCIEWVNYFNLSDLKVKIEIFFKEKERKSCLVSETIILKLLSINLIYKFCYDDKYYFHAKNLYNLACQSHLSMILTTLIISSNLKKLKTKVKQEDPKIMIRSCNTNLFNLIKNLLELFSNKEIKNSFNFYLNSRQNLKLSEICEFIKQYLVEKKTNLSINNDLSNDQITKNKNISILSDVVNDKVIKKQPTIPFIKIKPLMPYSLILDLDETLIHLNLNKITLTGLITFRPGLFEFLEEVSKLYELIIFTCGTRSYANPIIDLIEKEKKYFDHRLYRDHTLFKDNEFVKDLALIGRKLTNLIMIDNIPSNFKLQKENGIAIKSFYTEDVNDKSLFKITPIIKKIVENMPRDIRKEVLKYRKDLEKCIVDPETI